MTREYEPELLIGPAYAGMTPDAYNALLAVVAAVREAGPWPRCINTQAGRSCLDCGIQAGLSHRDTCLGVRLRDALARYDATKVAENAARGHERRENGE